MSAVLFWVGMPLMVTSVLWYARRPQDRPLPGLAYLTGIVMGDVSLIFTPGIKGWELYTAIGLLTALGLLFLAFSMGHDSETCPDCEAIREVQARFEKMMEESNGVSTVVEGQDDGVVPEGAEDDA